MNIMRKYSKFIIVFLLAVMLLPTTVKAAEIGWPIDVVATESTEIAGEEAPAIEESVVVAPTDTTASSGLSAIDSDSVDLEDKAIFPEEEYGLINRLETGPVSEELDMAGKIYSNYSDVVPVVTTDQMVEWILKKGNEIISILQIFAQPFAIIIFIVSCAIALIGSLTKGNMAGKGLIDMVASAVLYAACLYAPVIVNSISSFMAS